MPIKCKLTESKAYRDSASLASWEGLNRNAEGDCIEMPGNSSRSIQFSGTFGVGATVSLEGSNDGETWVVLTDPQGNPIRKTSPALETVQESVRLVRPVVDGGDNTTEIKATLFFKTIA